MALKTAYTFRGATIPDSYSKVADFHWQGGSTISIAVEIFASLEARDSGESALTRDTYLIDLEQAMLDPLDPNLTAFNGVRTLLYQFLKTQPRYEVSEDV
jgi:hypothetical protein